MNRFISQKASVKLAILAPVLSVVLMVELHLAIENKITKLLNYQISLTSPCVSATA